MIYIDCQEFTADAGHFFETILQQFERWLKKSKIAFPISIYEELDATNFRRCFNSLYNCWLNSGRTDRVVIVFDEVDKLFPDRKIPYHELILKEYVSLFNALRGLAQSHQNLVVLVAAYRSDINRRNYMSDAVGENPMFRAFNEVYIGFLQSSESKDLIQNVGRWKNIYWHDSAANQVFSYCGGHPLLTRYFASMACDQGKLSVISLDRVNDIAKECVREFRRNDIGNYYKEAVWELLYSDEQESLIEVHHAGINGASRGWYKSGNGRSDNQSRKLWD